MPRDVAGQRACVSVTEAGDSNHLSGSTGWFGVADCRRVTSWIRESLSSHEGGGSDRSDLVVCVRFNPDPCFRFAFRSDIGITGHWDAGQRAAARIAITDPVGTVAIRGPVAARH